MAVTVTDPILRLENVSYAYPDGPNAVDHLSVCVNKGERVAVLGRNGAGKSTFFLLCNGVLEPETGSIFCAGKAAVSYTHLRSHETRGNLV